MAEKRFYWLKLKENYFDSPKIKKLRKIAGGDTYTIIYLKMQLLSICNGGIINFEGIELSFEEELALKLDEQLEDVQLTLAYLKQQKLVEESDESFLLIEACNNIGSEGQSAERKRRFDARKQERALLGNDSVTEEKRNSISISNISNLNSNNIDNNIHLQDNKEKENIDDYDFSEDLKNAVILWLQHKKEKKQSYKPTGLKMLLRSLDKMKNEFGEKYAISAIENSIEKNYAGIYSDSRKNAKSNTKYDDSEEYTVDYAEENRRNQLLDGCPF